MEKWLKLGLLNESDCDFSIHNKDIGVYKATLDEQIVYIGKATELDNGGFRKRLRDYTRSSNSARNYPSGKLMNKYQNEVSIDILIMNRSKEAIILIENKETELIKKFNPLWNQLDNQ